jgi:hypothetical protein
MAMAGVNPFSRPIARRVTGRQRARQLVRTAADAFNIWRQTRYSDLNLTLVPRTAEFIRTYFKDAKAIAKGDPIQFSTDEDVDYMYGPGSAEAQMAYAELQSEQQQIAHRYRVMPPPKPPPSTERPGIP